MKRFIHTLIFILSAWSASAQWRPQPYKMQFHGVKPDSLLILPKLPYTGVLLEDGAVRYSTGTPQLYKSPSWFDLVYTGGSYSNPSWITALAWSKVSGTPTTLSGYGILDATPSSRTLTLTGGSDISVSGGTQSLSANRSWNVNNTSTFGTVAGRGNIANVPIYVTGNFIDIQGVSPFLGFNDGTSSIRGLSGDLINVVDTGRFFKVINGVGGIEMLAIDFNKATFNVLAEGVTPPAGAVGLEVPTAAWVRSRIGDSLSIQDLQTVTKKGNVTSDEMVSSGGFRISTAPGGNGMFFSNASNTLRWIVRGLNTESGSNAGYDLVFNGRTDAGANMGDALTLKRSNLSVGIGVNDPTSRLHIRGSSSTTGAALTVENLASSVVFQAANNGEITINGVKYCNGTGSPEGAITAPVGSVYTNKSGGAGTTLYIKESGAGNTGWIAK